MNKSVKLADVAVLVRGVSYPKDRSSKSPRENFAPIYRANNINASINNDDLVYVDRNLIKEVQFTKPGDILIAMSSGSKQLVGKTAQITEDNDTAFGAFCGLIRPSSAINSRYLGYYFQTENYRNFVSNASQGIGINNLRREHIENLVIPIFPPETQEAIVNKIDELLSEIDSAEASIDKASSYIKPYERAVIDSFFRNVEEGAAMVTLGEAADVKGGITKGRKVKGKTIGETPYLRVANVQDGYLALGEIKTIDITEDELDKYLLQQGDVLFTEGGDKDKLGRGTIWNDEVVPCIHQNHIFRARPDKSRFLSEYISLATKTTRARDYFFSKAKQTTNLASLNMTNLKNLEIAKISIDEQMEIVGQIVEKLDEAAAIKREAIVSYHRNNTLRQTILAKAFNGELL